VGRQAENTGTTTFGFQSIQSVIEYLLHNFQTRTICPKRQLVVDDRLTGVAYSIITI